MRGGATPTAPTLNQPRPNSAPLGPGVVMPGAEHRAFGSFQAGARGMNRTAACWPAMTTAHLTLVPPHSLGLSQGMTDTPPLSPFRLTPARIILLVFGALALAYIIGGTLFGGVESYDQLKQARNAAISAEEASAAQ